jgi:hypothetical protein
MADSPERNKLIAETAQATREKFGQLADPNNPAKDLLQFGVLNHPLPPALGKQRD